MRLFMHFKPSLFRCLFFWLLSCGLAGSALAGPGQPPVIQVLDGSLGQLAKDSFRIVSDTMFFDHAFDAALVKPYLVRNTVTFKIDPYSRYAVQSDFSATIRLELTMTASDGGNSVVDTSLTVRYRKDSLVVDQDRYLFSNGYSVKVKVLDRSTDVSWDVWKLLRLDNELQSFPVFAFHCETDTIVSVSHAVLDSATTSDELGVSWTAVTGADQYDLEWSYIDSSALNNPLHLYGNPGPDPGLVFDNNSSRVTITGTSYRIPIFYDGAGTLFFRIRPVQLQAGGGRTEGHWSSDHQPAGSFYFKGHQRNLNWQSTASYAEEGKRKVVLQYYDGSLRGRQTVTKDNTTNTTVVAESYYDYQGRPTIQVMPAPTFSNVIQYSKNFNLGMNGAYDKNDFDSIYDASTYCNSGAAAMKNDSGAALYYSSLNPEKDNGFNKFIPDAKGYPFTQVEYVQDNTGRISRQSGVGPDHRLGSGHETKYYYGSPDQHELDALFGTEVGDHSHYFKTMVRDANGQFSVSYTDMHGRTIATALAGTPPDSIRLDTLASYKAQNITETLADPGSNSIHDLVMESKKGLLVAVPGNHVFQYRLDPASLQLPDCNNTPVCYDCLYDLEIVMTDDCNNQKLGGKPFDTVFHNFSLASLPDTTCSNNAGSFSVSFTKYLEEGSYEVTKRLSISRYAESYYRDSVFMKRNSCKSVNTFVQEQRAVQAAIIQCQPTCQSCQDSLGDYTSYHQRFVTRAGIAAGDTSYDAMIRTAYAQAQDDCKALCDQANQEDDIEKAMLLDLTPPSGQYANVDSAKDIYSIFFLRQRSGSGSGVSAGEDSVANYQLATSYVDDNGQPDMIYDEATGTYVKPQDLGAQSFSDKFKLSWAQSLLQYHPEYNKLVKYKALTGSAAWDKRFESVNTYAEALQKGYLDPTGNAAGSFARYLATGTADYDPLSLITTYPYKDSLNNRISKYMPVSGSLAPSSGYITLWEYATASIKCAGRDASCFSGFTTDGSAFTSDMCSGDLDMAWRTFRQAYLDNKQAIINNVLKNDLPLAKTLIAAHRQPHFSDAAELAASTGLNPATSDVSTLKSQAQTQLNHYYDSTCLSYATMWWQSLKPCNYTSTDSAAIIPLLIQVCREGSDGTHPYGASSVAPSSTNQYKSFEDVIDQYNKAHNIPLNASCNAYAIKAPAPYDQQVVYSTKPLWAKPSDCECSQIQAMYANYQATTGHYTSFSDYLHKAYQTDISDADLTTLLNMCNAAPGSSSCNYLATPIQLPPALQCNAGDVCVGSTQFKTLDSAFRAEFPGVSPTLDPNPNDSAQVAANKLYEDYMNSHLGFGKTAIDYLDFLGRANGNSSQKVDSLRQLLTTFNTSWYPDTVSLDTTHFAIGIPFEDDLHLMPSIYPQVFSGGVAHISPSMIANTPYAGTTLTFVKNDTICNLNNHFTFEVRYKMDSLYYSNPCRNNNIVFWESYPDILVASTGVSMDEVGYNCGGGIYYCTNSYACQTDTVNHDSYKANVLDWVTVKVVVNNGTMQVYANGNLIRSMAYPHSVNRITRYAMGDALAYLDYVRVYDGNGKLQYSEEFEDSKQSLSNYPDAFSCKGSWASSFTTWFNQHTGKSYSYGQVDSVYKLIGVSLTPYSGIIDSTATPLATKDSCTGSTYIQTFTAAGNEVVRNMAATPDGGYLTVGYFKPTSSNQDAFVAKTNKNGKLLWYKSYGNSANEDLVKVRQTADGGFIATGTSNAGGRIQILVIKCDAAGTVQWSRTLNSGSSTYESPVDIIQMADGGYAIAANYDLDHASSDAVRWEIIRLNTTGGVTWANTYNSSGKNENAGGLVEDGGALIFSGLFTGHSYYDGAVLKLNEADGSIIWGKDYDIANRSNWFRDIYSTPSGYVINSLSTEEFAPDGDGDYGNMKQTVIEIDKSGAVQYFLSKQGHVDKVALFDHPGGGAGVMALTPDSSGGYTITQSEYASPKDIYTTKNLSGGYILSTNRQVLSGDQQVVTLLHTPGGGLEAAGNHGTVAMILKMDSTGKTGCFDSAWTIQDSIPFDTSYNQTFSATSLTGVVNSSAGLTATTISATNTYLCNNICDSGRTAVRDSLFLCGRAAPVFAPVNVNAITNCSDSSFFIASKSSELHNAYSDSLRGNFDSTYRQKCLQAYNYESFTVTHAQSEYHYTLYYYDQAGNLLKTVPPAGVNANYDPAWLNSVAAARAAGSSVVPSHGMLTQYRYNTLNQVMAQQAPDAGQSLFWYDRLGRLAISQNARQKAAAVGEHGRQYSYTLYDGIGRITEVGQVNNTGTTPMSDDISRNAGQLTGWLNGIAAGKEQITQTVYDIPYAGYTGLSFTPLVQRNLRNRVSYTSFTTGSNPAQYDQGTFYTYDIEGNVDTLLQDYGSATTGIGNIMNRNGNRWKRIVYQYDLVSGKVNSVAYQPHQVDAFYHRYTYDAENRLILSESSADSVYWDRDARYEYYKHGPLAREILGDKQVQGLDYAYTLQGWLKGVNSTSLSQLYDMSGDGDTLRANRYIARDAYGYSLNYYAGDYTPIGTGVMPFPGSSAYLNNAYRPLFNGNISSMAVNLGALYRTNGVTNDNSHWRGPLLYNYRYDQLNRITGLDAYYGLDQSTNNWSGLQPTADFRERVGYDGNGNIQRYVRNNFGETGLPMDSLGYKYIGGRNQLEHIVDSASDAVGGGYDLHSQPSGNYKYDSIGNLVYDSSEHISAIKWNVYGKITEIDRSVTSATRPTKAIYYYYDAAGNRIGKKTTRGDNSRVTYTWYVRDASGNVMATYTAEQDSTTALANGDLQIGEKHIYGSRRLGILGAGYSTDAATDGLNVYTSPWTGVHLPYYTGRKQYELTNHLGNVLATISDRKIGVPLATDGSLTDHYEADIQSAQDYYPFGMVMPGRMYTVISIPGGTTSGQSTVNGYTLPVDLDLTSRGGSGAPNEYVATQMIDLSDGFESRDIEDVSLYIADATYAGTGNESSGLAGSGKYRYGFNGKEQDNEVKGYADQVDYGMRIYDPRVGRFMSVDPLQKQFPFYTPYQFSANSPILFIDLDGREPKIHLNNWQHSYTWAKKDYYDDGYSNYFTLKEKDSKGRAFLVRTTIIGQYPRSLTKYQYYNYDEKDYDYFVPTGYEPDYVQNILELHQLGEFGRAMEKASVIGALAWHPAGRDILATINLRKSIDKIQTTEERIEEIKTSPSTQALPAPVRNGVMTVAVADAKDSKGRPFRLVSLNSASYKDQRIYNSIQSQLKPNEILVPNLLSGDAHAEENLEAFTRKYGLEITDIDVSRDYCKNCSEWRRRNGARTSTPTSTREPKQRPGGSNFDLEKIKSVEKE